jgi:DNA processing protein
MIPREDQASLRDGLAFSLLPKIGAGAYRAGVERCGSAAAAFRQVMTGSEVREAQRAADELIARSRSIGAGILLLGEPGYPASLMELPQPPSRLFALGSLSLLERRCVGIVGTRHSSTDGERIAYQMAGALARAGAVVVSGMAFGIDSAAHRGALDAGGGTIAVLGGGADVPYPPSHAALHQRIIREGLVLSEAAIGTRPGKGAFPKRNRIIAGLSEPLIVIEAGARSGALITSHQALELGRTVAAVPGPIDSPRHVGSNRLLADGAMFIGSIDDALSIAGVGAPAKALERITAPEALNVDDRAHAKILHAVRTGATDIEDLARSTSLAPRDFANALVMLELHGQLVITDGATVSLGSS